MPKNYLHFIKYGEKMIIRKQYQDPGSLTPVQLVLMHYCVTPQILVLVFALPEPGLFGEVTTEFAEFHICRQQAYKCH